MAPESTETPAPTAAGGETWITIAEAAQRSGRSPTQFYVWRSKGRSPVRMEERNGKVCVHADDLQRWTDANPKRGPTSSAPLLPRGSRLSRTRAGAPPAEPEAAAEDAPRDELQPVPRAAAGRGFSFRCETGAELKAWADLLEELGRRGVRLAFRVEGGRITVS
jgi:hypothetical protein